MPKGVRPIMLCVLGAAFLLAVVPQPGLAAGNDRRFQIKLWGGGAYVGGGDLNAGLKGLADYWLASDSYYGWHDVGEYKPAHLGFEFGGDFIFYITRNFGVGIGAGYVQASKDSSISSTWGSITDEYTFMPKASAFVLRFLNLVYSLPIGQIMRFNIFGGAGYYFGKADASFRYDWHGGDWDLYSYTANGGGIGFHSGFEFEFILARNISLFIQAAGRYANTGNYDGTYHHTAEGGYSYEEMGDFYYYEALWRGGAYPRVVVNNVAPSGSGIQNVRKAKLDFSGFTFGTGVNINF